MAHRNLRPSATFECCIISQTAEKNPVSWLFRFWYFFCVPITIAKLTIEEALNLFYTNRKLLAILITKTGNYNEPALGIITVSDIIDLNAMLDNYGVVAK